MYVMVFTLVLDTNWITTAYIWKNECTDILKWMFFNGILDKLIKKMINNRSQMIKT